MKTPLPRHGYWLSPGPSHDENHKAYWNNFSAAMPQMHITFPSARDPGWKHRYPGKSTAQIVVPARSEWFDHWRSTGWNNRGDEYGRLKSDFASRMLLPLFRLYPEVERALDFSELSTPLSTQYFTTNVQGESLGLAQTPSRFGVDVLSPRTPVTNLFLTGSEITVSGVGVAAHSGLLTAVALLGAESVRYSDLLRR